jgi:hypothetical protein
LQYDHGRHLAGFGVANIGGVPAASDESFGRQVLQPEVDDLGALVAAE